MLRIRIGFVVVALAALVAAGCGSDDTPDTTPTATWAESLCSALVTWKGSLTSAVDSLKGGNLSKDGFESAANEAKDATQTLVSDLKGLGKPDTEAGADAQSAVSELSDQLSTDVDQIQSAVEDASGVSGLVSAISTVSTTLTSMGSQLTSTLSTLQGLDAKGELEDAFSQAQSCKDLTGS